MKRQDTEWIWQSLEEEKRVEQRIRWSTLGWWIVCTGLFYLSLYGTWELAEWLIGRR